MSDNTLWSTKVGVMLLSDLFSSDIPLDFCESIWIVSLKYLLYFLAGIKLNNIEIFLKKNILLH